MQLKKLLRHTEGGSFVVIKANKANLKHNIKMKTLILINDTPYGAEKAYNALRLAN